MHSVELLNEALDAARRVGFEIREEWLDGAGGGACRIRGNKLLFLDLSASPRQRLEQTLAALRSDAATVKIVVTAALRSVLEVGKAA